MKTRINVVATIMSLWLLSNSAFGFERNYDEETYYRFLLPRGEKCFAAVEDSQAVRDIVIGCESGRIVKIYIPTEEGHSRVMGRSPKVGSNGLNYSKILGLSSNGVSVFNSLSSASNTSNAYIDSLTPVIIFLYDGSTGFLWDSNFPVEFPLLRKRISQHEERLSVAHSKMYAEWDFNTETYDRHFSAPVQFYNPNDSKVKFLPFEDPDVQRCIQDFELPQTSEITTFRRHFRLLTAQFHPDNRDTPWTQNKEQNYYRASSCLELHKDSSKTIQLPPSQIVDFYRTTPEGLEQMFGEQFRSLHLEAKGLF